MRLEGCMLANQSSGKTHRTNLPTLPATSHGRNERRQSLTRLALPFEVLGGAPPRYSPSKKSPPNSAVSSLARCYCASVSTDRRSPTLPTSFRSLPPGMDSGSRLEGDHAGLLGDEQVERRPTLGSDRENRWACASPSVVREIRHPRTTEFPAPLHTFMIIEV